MTDLREHPELEEFLAECEEHGSVTTLELEAFAIALDLEDDDLSALRAQLVERNVEILESASADRFEESSGGGEASDAGDALGLLLRRASRYRLLTARGGGAREADRARRRGGEGADDELEPRLVVSIAKRYQRQMPLLDLVQKDDRSESGG
jgi:hypothetical protein